VVKAEGKNRREKQKVGSRKAKKMQKKQRNFRKTKKIIPENRCYDWNITK
jgi:hypothetical protein